MSITKEQISAVMSVENTNPLVAYYMLRDQVPYQTAVDYYQKHNLQLNYLNLSGKDDLEQTVQKYIYTTGLTRDEVDLLLSVPYPSDFDVPTEAEAKAMYPDSKYPLVRFMYGCTESAAANLWEEDDFIQKAIDNVGPGIAAICTKPYGFCWKWYTILKEPPQ